RSRYRRRALPRRERLPLARQTLPAFRFAARGPRNARVRHDDPWLSDTVVRLTAAGGPATIVESCFGHPRLLLELEDRGAHRACRFRGGNDADQCVAKTANGARVKLGDARFVHADLRADLLHRRVLIVVEADDLLLAGRQRFDRRTDA